MKRLASGARRALALALMGALAATACSSSVEEEEADGGQPAPTDASSGQRRDASVGDAAAPSPDVGLQLSDAAVEGADASAWVPGPRRSACASPTISEGAFVSITPESSDSNIALAWNGTEAALAISDYKDADRTSTIKLQRLDAAGKARGSPVTLGTLSGVARVTVADMDASFVVCWGPTVGAATVRCSVVDAHDAVTSGFSAVGTNPAAARGPGGVLLLYRGTNALLAQRLNAAAAAQGSPLQLPAVSVAAAVTATPSGFAVVSDDAGKLKLRRFDAGLSAKGSPVEITAWTGGAVEAASAGETVAVTWIDSGLVTVDAAGAVSVSTRLDTSEGFYRVDTAGGADSFAFTWAGATRWSVRYRTASLAGVLQGSEKAAMGTASSLSRNALAAVADGFLLAVIEPMGLCAIRVSHLECP